jgi:hypothetical protein
VEAGSAATQEIRQVTASELADPDLAGADLAGKDKA